MRSVSLLLALAALVFGATLAVAEPGLVVRYANGVPQITLAGDFAGSLYTVRRAPASGGDFVAITPDQVLCLGACFAEDRTAQPGQSYLYRFDLLVPNGEVAQLVTYGPFHATISPALARPIGVFAYPNPGRGQTTLELQVGGTEPVQGEAAIYDLAGRQVRTIHRGVMPGGLTTVQWDGRDERGQVLRGGVYLLRFAAHGHQTTTRIVRR